MSIALPEALSAHAPVLLVMIPLFMSAVVAAQPSGRFGWVAALVCTGLSAVFALDIARQVAESGLISYAMGDWAPPLGIEFRIDALNAALLLLLSGMAVVTLVFALPSVADEIAADKRSLFYSAFLICFSGLAGVASTGDAFNMFVFLEISSIPTYALIAMGYRQNRMALTASFNYLILGTIGATFFVIGVGFLFMATGTLNMADIAVRLGDIGQNRMVDAAYAFILVGIGLKAALFPLHLWLPNGYAYAPHFVTAFLASTATKVAFYVLIRFQFDVFDPASPLVAQSLTYVITPLAVIGMIVASVQASFQSSPRRLLAFSSVAQVGYMMLGLGIATGAGVAAGMLHLLNHALMKGALFLALGVFALAYGVRRLEDLKGLGQTMPLTAVAFTIGGASLIGVPFTAGFVSKFYLVQAALERDWWWAVAAIMISSVLAVAYMARMLVPMWLMAPEGRERAPHRAPLAALVPLWILALANIWFGANAGWFVSLSQAAGQAAINGLGLAAASMGGAS
jgi:multicomponent Na+:H+ antiporter subunit D